MIKPSEEEKYIFVFYFLSLSEYSIRKEEVSAYTSSQNMSSIDIHVATELDIPELVLLMRGLGRQMSTAKSRQVKMSTTKRR